jgi:hypothetical protein
MSSFVDLLFGVPVTREQRYEQTIAQAKKAVREASRSAERYEEDADEMRIKAKNQFYRGDPIAARQTLKHAVRKRRAGERFTSLGQTAEDLQDRAQRQGIEQKLLDVQDKLARLARSTAPRKKKGEEGESNVALQQATKRGEDVGRLARHFEVATEAFKIGANDDDDPFEEDDILGAEDEAWIDNAMREFGEVAPVAKKSKARSRSSLTPSIIDELESLISDKE